MTTNSGQVRPAPGQAHPSVRPLALVTGVGRTVGIGAGIVAWSS
ncbi:hypothetical protein ACFC01_46190 [Streptomyces mirabilis]